MVDIVWFKDLNKDSIGIAGGKGASLGEMYNVGIPVPPGFVVTAQAFKEFLESTHLDKKIKEILSKLDVNNTKQLTETANEIKKLILKEESSPTLQQAITEAYDNLNIDEKLLGAGKDVLDIVKSGREQPFVAVRSSATAEDLPEASFAGQQETFLNVKGDKLLIHSIKKCWASLFTPRAIFYREKNNFPHEKVLIAVIVQKMVDSQTAGVMFSVNPTTNNRNEILIEAGYGLGEAIVSGAINPDLYILDKESLEIKKREIKKQSIMIIKDVQTGETIKKKVSPEMQEKQVLEESEILKLAELAKKLEKHYGKAQDIEFAIDKKVYIVQSRPVTTLKEEVKSEELKGELLTKGLAASPGVASGPVRIIKSEEEMHSFEKGEVLVTKMTNPTMVPIMEKAAAIVTDEGGITSHASIVSRELGTPCIVGTENATDVLNKGLIITVDGFHGKVFKGEIGKYQEQVKKVTDTGQGIETKTKIYMNLGEPSLIDRYKELNFDGIGLMRLEFIIAGLGKHPNQFIKENKQEEYVNGITKAIETVAKVITPRPIIVRFSDFKTNEYKDLKGGEEFEEHEDNPMIGWRGVSRYISEDFKEAFRLECEAIKKVRESYKNVHVMLPFVRNTEEVKNVLEVMKEKDLEASDNFKIWIMAEVPSLALITEDFASIKEISGASIGSNDLAMLCLGVDRDSEKLGKMGYFDERNKAVLTAMKQIIEGFKKHNKTTSLCGQSASNYPEIAEFLVKEGITSISVNPDVVGKTRRIVAEAEKKLNIS